jgi:hypothetical protein
VLAFRFERPWWAHASWLAWPLMTLLAFFGVRWWDRRKHPKIPQARAAST